MSIIVKQFLFTDLSTRLKKEKTIQGKLLLLQKQLATLFEFPSQWDWISDVWPQLSDEQRLVLLAFIATGQAERVLHSPLDLEKVKIFLNHLIPVEKFYAPIGGIIGYHQIMLTLLEKHEQKPKERIHFHVPPLIDFTKKNRQQVAAVWGLEHLDKMAEIYPVGGAADRLALKDEKSGDFLPAALLQFFGKPLLEYLVTDLQSREYLYYKLFGKQLTTPIAMMTSPEKENHERILEICQKYHWFGRSKESFRLFMQPLVPTINPEGQWILQSSLQLLLKPGGHGVIWRLAEQEGIFDWLASQNRSKGLVRQINNIIAGVDDGLISFIGLGCKKNSHMGFASCSRFVRTSEGINVLVEKKQKKQTFYCLTNIEYCDFDRYGIEDERASLWNPYSKYPANTNVLFVDLKSVRQASKKVPFPGMLVNAKKIKFIGENGQIEEEEVLRLEATMQNIADCFAEDKPPSHSYLTYNVRHKTISPIKRAFIGEGSLFETPEGSFYDTLKNARELLVRFCHFTVPELPTEEDFLKEGPSFLFLYHPALGPLYSLIGQKIHKGSLAAGSELRLEIADLQIENLHVEGSFLIRTNAVMGHFDTKDILQYSEKTGKCRLKNVRISNAGWKSLSRSAWKEDNLRTECCEIFLEEGAEFEAEDIVLTGPFKIHVPKGIKMKVTQKDGKIEWLQQPLTTASWGWSYSIVEGEMIAQLFTGESHKETS